MTWRLSGFCPTPASKHYVHTGSLNSRQQLRILSSQVSNHRVLQQSLGSFVSLEGNPGQGDLSPTSSPLPLTATFP